MEPKMKAHLEFEILNRDDVIAHVVLDGFDVSVEYFSDFFLDRPFGNKLPPTFNQLYDYFESRCVPRTRGDIDDILEILGLDSYDPLAIVKITHGVMNEDFEWIRFKGEELVWNDVRVR